MAFFGKPKQTAAPMTPPEPIKTASPFFGEAPSQGSRFVGEAPARGRPFGDEDEQPSIVIDFNQQEQLYGFLMSLVGSGLPVLSDPLEMLGGEPPYVALSSSGVSAKSLFLPEGLLELLDGPVESGSQFIAEIPLMAIAPGAESLVVSFDWVFGSSENSEFSSDPLQNDVAFFFTSDGRVELLSSVVELLPREFSSWQTTTLRFDVTDLPEEGISFGFGVLEIGDEEDSSALLVDNITLIGLNPFFVEGAEI